VLLEEEQTYCFQFAYYLYTVAGQYLKSFEFSPDINPIFKEKVENIVSTLEKSCNFVMKRNGPLTSIKLRGRLRAMRILAFAIIYFIIHFIFLFNIQYLWGAPEFQWYLRHPFEALHVIFSEVAHNPLMILPFFILAFYALLLGFITDTALSHLIRCIQRRKKHTRCM